MEGPAGSLIPVPMPSPWVCHIQRPPGRMAIDAMRACVPCFTETGPFHTTVLRTLVHMLGFLSCNCRQACPPESKHPLGAAAAFLSSEILDGCTMGLAPQMADYTLHRGLLCCMVSFRKTIPTPFSPTV